MNRHRLTKRAHCGIIHPNMKFSICNELFEDWAIEDVFRTVAEIGYDAVEIAPFTLAESSDDVTPTRRAEIVRAAEASGIEIAGLHWLLKSPQGLYLNHPDAGIRARTREYLDSCIRLCADLGGRVLIFGSPKQRDVFPGLSYEHAWEYARETFVHCGQTAGDAGVYLCIEALARRETDFINTLTEALRMVREVDKPYFKAMVDTKAISDDGRPLPEIIREGGEDIRHVHVNEPDGRGPGTGNLDFGAVAVTLREIGYDGYVSVEVFDFKPDPITIARDSLQHLRRSFSE